MGLRLGNLDKKLICICNLNSSRAASSGEFKFKTICRFKKICILYSDFCLLKSLVQTIGDKAFSWGKPVPVL